MDLWHERPTHSPLAIYSDYYTVSKTNTRLDGVIACCMRLGYASILPKNTQVSSEFIDIVMICTKILLH